MDGDMPDDWRRGYDPFEGDRDLTGPSEGEYTYLDWLNDQDIDDINNITVNLADADPEGLRGQRFDTQEEALQWLFDTGLIGFSRVVRYPMEGDDEDHVYGVEVGDTGPVEQ